METPIKSFMADINSSGKLKRLDRKTEEAYISIYRDRSRPVPVRIAAKNAVLGSHMPFIVSCARKFSTKDMPVSDLVNEAFVGLSNAIDRYDPAREAKFLSYAVWWIRESIESYINNRKNLVRIPANTRAELRSVFRESSRTGKSPESVAEERGRDGIVADALAALVPVSMDTPVRDAGRSAGSGGQDGGELTLGDTLAGPDLSDELADSDTREKLRAAVKELPARELRVVRDYFGLESGSGLTYRQIGEPAGCSGERIRQIKKRALRKLAGRLEGTRLCNLG